MKTITLIFLFLGVFCCMPLFAEEYVIKFSHVVAEETPKGKAARLLAELINQNMTGKLRMEVYANSMLYDDDEVLDALRLSSSKNQVLLAAPSMSKLEKYSGKMNVFDVPFLFDDVNDVHAVIDSNLMPQITDEMETSNLKVLTFWDNGMKIFTLQSDAPQLTIPDDFAGKTFRIQSSKIYETFIQKMGGIPIKLRFIEVYNALQSGLVDGQENTWSNIYTQNFHQLQNYAINTRHNYLGYVLITNLAFWNDLPADIRSEFMKYLKIATKYNRDISDIHDKQGKEAILKSKKINYIELTDAQRKHWKNTLSSIQENISEKIGKKLMKNIQELVDNQKKGL